MRSMLFASLTLLALLSGCGDQRAMLSADAARQQVMDTEKAFAKTMADRDAVAFASFLSEEAIFMSGETPLRGRQAISEGWAPFYAGPAAPFSWEPEDVEVLTSGDLALSSGPVRDPQGKVVARFTSIWRREASGAWRIVFDKGSDVCRCGALASG